MSGLDAVPAACPHLLGVGALVSVLGLASLGGCTRPQAPRQNKESQPHVAASVVAKAAPEVHGPRASPALQRQPGLKATGMLALPSGRLLLWSEDGQIQLGTVNEGWEGSLHLPLAYLINVVVEEGGALVGGSRQSASGSESGVAVAIDDHGAVLRKWELPEGMFSAVAVHGSQRWAISLDDLFMLRSDGAIERSGAVELGSDLRITPGGQWVFCVPVNLTAAHSASAKCAARGKQTWRAEGRWTTPPLLCGRWLVEAAETHVVVRSLETGLEVQQKPIEKGAAVACAAEDTVLIGASHVEALHLPNLTRRWQVPADHGRVQALASVGDRVAVLSTTGKVAWLK